MQRDLSFSNEGRKKLKAGIDKAADAITVTMGGAGRNVLIEKMTGYPLSTADGVTVARSIELKDRIENMGAMRIREAAEKTVEVGGDGTTTSALLTQKIIGYGMECVEAGLNPVDLKRGIEKAADLVVEELKRLSTPADDAETLKKIATISARNDEEIGGLIAQAIDKVGRDGIVEVEEAKGYDTTVEMVEGMQFDRGYLSPYFFTDQSSMKCELENPMILLYDKQINTVKEIENSSNKLLTKVAEKGRPLLIISEGLGDEMLNTMIRNKLQNGFKICAIKLPTFGGSKDLVMEDIATLTNGRYISEKKGSNLKTTDITAFGSADRVVITKDKTTIIGGAGGKELVDKRVAQLREELNNAEFDVDKVKLKERIAKLSNGIAVIRVGGATESEISDRKDRIDDALQATRAAVDEGYVAGGGVTFMRCANVLLKAKGDNDAETSGIVCVQKALSDPTKKILENAGLYTTDIMDKINGLAYGIGMNVKTGNLENLLVTGIIDPAKVARVAFQNAVSVAALFLTTECIISNLQND